MSLYIASVSTLGVILVIQSIAHYLHAKSQQQTIESLADRIMSRDYREYKLMNAPPPEEPRTRKPMSAFDDPFLPGDEDEENYS